MTLSRRSTLLAAPVLALAGHVRAQEDKLRFAVGPSQPTAGDTRRAYEPFFRRLAGRSS